MSSFLEMMKKYALAQTVFYLILGVAMLLFPEVIIAFIIYVLAAYAIIMGIMSMITARKSGGTNGMVGGILLVILGVFMFIFSQAIASILPIFVGILLIIIGVAQVVQAVGAKQYTGKISVLQLVLGILVLIGGVVGVFNPFGSLVFLFRVFGAVMIIMGVNELSLYLALRKGGAPPAEK